MSDLYDIDDSDDEEIENEAPFRYRLARARIVYVENKFGGLEGPIRIGRVFFSKTGRTLYYRGRRFKSLKGGGYKSDYYDVDTGEEFWISGPRKDRNDRLYGGNAGVAIDEDVRREYVALPEGPAS